jgi:FKBP-type peptidyl-prolyl cis-trans isomerase
LDAGLTYVDLNCGTGPVVHTGEVAVVSYVGKLADGKVFDSTEEHGKPLPVRLGAGTVIPGWEIGIPGMAVGGTRRLIIPPDLAYGKQGYPGVIPPNATLTFDVTLVKLKP